MATTVNITDKARPAIAALKGGLQGSRINPGIGAAVKLLFQRHFLALPPNKMGFPSTHFWAGAARATNFQVLADGVLLSVNQQGVRQRLMGGVIRPVKGKFLTIPANAEARGKRAREFDNLRVVKFKSGRLALVEAEASEISISKADKKGKRFITHTASRTGLVPFFWLVQFVNQQPDPGVIPTQQQIAETAMTEVRAAVARAKRRQATRNDSGVLSYGGGGLLLPLGTVMRDAATSACCESGEVVTTAKSACGLSCRVVCAGGLLCRRRAGRVLSRKAGPRRLLRLSTCADNVLRSGALVNCGEVVTLAE